jgi:type I restriction enzyme S subunit
MRDGLVETKLGQYININTGKLDVNAASEFGEYPFFTCSRETYRIDEAAFEGEFVLVAGNGDLNVKYYDGKFNAYQRTYVLNSIDRSILDNQFLFLYMQSYIEYLRSETRGTVIQYLKKGQFADANIKLPSLAEQKRIVDLISSVDSYIETLQQQLESAKKSRNAVLHEFLTAGGDNWVETTLGEVAHLNPEQARDYDSDRLIKYIDLSTVTFDTGISTEIEQLPFNEAPGRARRIIREKDVIVSTVRPYLKGFAFVGKEFNGQIASTGFCVIRPKSESILSELIWALVGSDDFVDFLIRRSTGSNYPAVRPNDISDFTFMLPPLHDQETVSKLITTFDDTIRASAVLIDSAKNLRSGLLSDLLSGSHEIPATYDKVLGDA